MMTELPETLAGGEEARLIPVGAGDKKERNACSVLLASLRVVQPFARSFFGRMNVKIGSWPHIRGYIQPLFTTLPEGGDCQPEGLLIVDSAKKQRRFLVHAKIGAAKIDRERVAQCCRLAAANNISAVVTISNEQTVEPTHLPYALPEDERRVPVFHWTWSYLIMIAELLLRADRDFNEEQDYILREIIRYFNHESTGIAWTQDMGADWPALVESLQAGTAVGIGDPLIANVVQSWHQQVSGICINRSRRLKLPVRLRLSDGHKIQRTRLAEDSAALARSHTLSAVFDFATPLPIVVTANVKSRQITCRLAIDAPLDRQRYRARMRWLLNQIPEELELPLKIELIWDGGRRSAAPLNSFREDVNAARLDSQAAPQSFEIVHTSDLEGKFADARKFVEVLEETLAAFYEGVARHLRPWQGTSDPIGDRRIVRRGEINGRSFVVFEDGSIEIDTGAGVKRFDSLSDLTAAAKNGHAGSPAMPLDGDTPVRAGEEPEQEKQHS
jgi:hypothetical protein